MRETALLLAALSLDKRSGVPYASKSLLPSSRAAMRVCIFHTFHTMHIGLHLCITPAGLKAKVKNRFPPDASRHRPQTLDLLWKMTVRTLPRTPGGRGDKNKIKNILK